MTTRPLLALLAAADVCHTTGASPPAPRHESLAPPGIASRYQAELAKVTDLEYSGLERELGLTAAPKATLGFDVEKAQYFDKVVSALKLTTEEKRRLVEAGVVSVDHQQRYSMASAYYAIYTRDLPVLVTVDSILHALHRSYDDVLKTLETTVFAWTIDRTLAAVDDEIERAAKAGVSRALRTTLADVDLYATVARNLLAGAAMPADEAAEGARSGVEPPRVAVPIPPRLAPQVQVERVLAKIQRLDLETPDSLKTSLRGAERPIDWSQFRPRGHYTSSPQLRRYFRAMMWLGRPDVGFVLDRKESVSAEIDMQRELRAAAAFVALLQTTGSLKPLQEMSDAVDFLVGAADDLSMPDLSAALARAKIGKLDDLDDEKKLADLRTAVLEEARGQARGQVRGQVVPSDPRTPVKTQPPIVFQVFGQRFGIDSFVLSQVVFDSVLFHGKKQRRMMPSGLDVMAAFGNDEAVSLLKSDIETHHYAANLLAARRTVEAETPASWNASAYGIWLDTLRLLSRPPSPAKTFPRAMLTEAWRRKVLQTQLASWSELRHDTVLYLKQSYTAAPVCEYPAGFVEPYPQVYARLGFLARELARRLPQAGLLRSHELFENFAARMGDLEKLARKELDAQPFTPEEADFLKKTIDRAGGGSGRPRYDGWYAGLFVSDPERWSPVVTDVHTDPDSHEVLQEGVGDANLLVVAVDNEYDRAVYVGPAYSYYEFRGTAERRMTNESWEESIAAGHAPPRPSWIAPLQGPASSRKLDAAPLRSRR